MGSVMGQWAYSVALAVYAYEAGGAKGVGIVALIRTIPSAIAAPFTSTLADRISRITVMVSASLGRMVTIGAAGAVILARGPAWVVYALAGLASILGTAFLPAESALLPDLARTPEELTAANVMRSTIDSIGSFAGPAIGGILLAFTSSGSRLLRHRGDVPLERGARLDDPEGRRPEAGGDRGRGELGLPPRGQRRVQDDRRRAPAARRDRPLLGADDARRRASACSSSSPRSTCSTAGAPPSAC